MTNENLWWELFISMTILVCTIGIYLALLPYDQKSAALFSLCGGFAAITIYFMWPEY